MKNVLSIGLCLCLFSLAATAQVEVPKSTTFTPASQATRWRLDGNSSGIGQTNNTGTFSRFALFSELSALSNGAATSVNSKTVTGGTSDIALTTDNIPEGVLKYYSDTRARSALSGAAPVSFNSGTGVFSMAAATGSVDGYLTAANFAVFNAKEPAIPSGTAAQFIAANKTVGTFSPATVGLGNVTNSLQVINAGGVLSFGGGAFSSRPAAGTANRYYIATDQGATYYDNGTTWTLQEPAITGDVAIALGATTSTLATVNSNVGTFGSATTVPVVNYDSKGRALSVSTATITATAIGSVPIANITAYSGLTGVTAPSAGFLKFIQVTTDSQYSETDDIYVIKPSGKIHKLPLLPSEN